MTTPVIHGFPDYGRTVARANKVWIRETITNFSSTENRGPLFVGDYTHLGLHLECTLDAVQIAIGFYEDVNGSNPLGAQVVDILSGMSMECAIPILGPYMFAALTPALGPATLTVRAWSVAGPAYGSFLGPAMPIIFGTLGTAIGAGVTTTVTSDVVWPGEAHLYGNVTATSWEIRLYHLDYTGAVTPLTRLSSSFTARHVPVYLPAGGIRAQIQNNDAAGRSYDLCLNARPFEPGR